MTEDQKHWAVMRDQMQAWYDQQEAAGWQSEEVKRCAKRVLLGLSACARNKIVGAALTRGLAEDTEALAKARSE